MKKGHILIIDDEEKLRHLLSRIFELEGFEVFQASNPKSALKLLEQKDIDVVLCDVKLPDMNGIDLAKQIKLTYPLLETIILTAYGNISDGVTAIKNGSFDYIVKGDDNDRIIPLVNRCNDKVQLQKRLKRIEDKSAEKYSLENIIGISKPIKDAILLAQKVAPTDASVLLYGETGTGKEIFAQAIHNASERRSKPFIAINCSAFPHELLESEMFGHKKGAFTGAISDKKGLFEEANQGTLFLDEIGDMPHELQAKLLRVLETQTYFKLGETKATHVNVRIIAATNKDLQEEATLGHFRDDLYFRLSVFKIQLPPLRDRKEDIPLLTSYFLNVYSSKTKKKILSYDETFIHKLIAYPWKGNTRELKNLIERAVIIADSDILTEDVLPLEFANIIPPENIHIRGNSLYEVEKNHILSAIAQHHGNKTKAAESLGIGLTTLYRKLELYGINH